MFNISLLSKANPEQGGASRVAADLGQLLSSRGHAIKHYVNCWAEKRPEHVSLLHAAPGLTYWNAELAKLSRLIGIPDFLSLELPIFLFRNRPPSDLLHIHDIPTAFSLLSIGFLAQRMPVVWIFHDCSPFTGGCIYPLACTAYRQRCHECPRFSETLFIQRHIEFYHQVIAEF